MQPKCSIKEREAGRGHAAGAKSSAKVVKEISGVNNRVNEMRISNDQVQLSAANLTGATGTSTGLVSCFNMQA